MNNFPIKISHHGNILEEIPDELCNNTYWISRSMAVATFIFTCYKEVWYIAAIKRGKGCPDNVGKWCCPCGYVDYNETIEEAAIRETKEEMDLDIFSPTLFGIHDNPDTANRQNVTFRFVELYSIFSNSLPKLSNKNCEPDEVEEVAWIPVGKIGEKEWAFDHDKIIFTAFLCINSEKSYDLFC